MQFLDLRGVLTEGCGRLPPRDEMSRQMREAGHDRVRSRNLIPQDRFSSFVGTRPEAGEVP